MINMTVIRTAGGLKMAVESTISEVKTHYKIETKRQTNVKQSTTSLRNKILTRRKESTPCTVTACAFQYAQAHLVLPEQRTVLFGKMQNLPSAERTKLMQ